MEFPMKRSLLLFVALLFAARPAAWAETPAEQLGWELAVHSYTFQKFSIFDAIDKTADLGVKYMSISGNVNLVDADGKIAKKPTITLSDQEFAAITTHL